MHWRIFGSYNCAVACDFQPCGICDQQSLRSACAYAQSDQSLCWTLEYAMTVKLMTEHNLVFLSFKEGCTCSSESTLVKMSSCWKSHAAAQLFVSLCRFDDASIVYHDEARDGLVKVCRLALYNKYPKYATEGFEALYSRPPVIYLSSAAKPGLSHYLCLQVSS